MQVNHFKEYIPKAFPHGNDLILDSEVLMIDTKTGKPLPFGTLGVHKVNMFINEHKVIKVYYGGDSCANRFINDCLKTTLATLSVLAINWHWHWNLYFKITLPLNYGDDVDLFFLWHWDIHLVFNHHWLISS